MSEPQPYREIDLIEALGRGFSAEDMVAAEQALQFFDGSYNSLIACLRQYGASARLIDAVMAVAEDEMGYARADVDILDANETITWGFGYGATTDEVRAADQIEPEEDLKFTTRYWFNNAKRKLRRRN